MPTLTKVGEIVDGTYAVNVNDFTIANGLLYIGAAGTTISIYDIANPASPSLVGYITDATTLNRPQTITVDGNYLYTVTDSAIDGVVRFVIVDVSNPASPSIVGTIVSNAFVSCAGIHIDGNYAVCHGARIVNVDISNKAAPSIAAQVTPTATNSVIVRASAKVGDNLWIVRGTSPHLRCYDVTPFTSSPTLVGSVAASTGQPSSIAVDGNYAYVVGSSGTTTGHLYVFDISNPASPSQVGIVTDAFWLRGAGSPIKVGNYVYVVADQVNRVAAVNVSTPTAPVLDGGWLPAASENPSWGTAVSGSYLFVGCRQTNRVAVLSGVVVTTTRPHLRGGQVARNAVRGGQVTLPLERLRGGQRV